MSACDHKQTERISWAQLPGMTRDLLAVKELVYDRCEFRCSIPEPDDENSAYDAYSFSLETKRIKSRAGKLTPTKTGLFVTFWKRAKDGSTQPFGIEDPFELFVVSARNGTHFGQFVFPVKVLAEQKVISVKGKGGKRGFRIYPPWDQVTSSQAQFSQTWQTKYFFKIGDGNNVDLDRARALYATGSLGH